MKQLTLFCAAILTAFMAYGQDSLLVADEGNNGFFRENWIGGSTLDNKPCPENTVTKTDNFYLLTWNKIGRCSFGHIAKTSQKLIDLTQWQSASIDVKIRKTDDADTTLIYFLFIPSEPGDERFWRVEAHRSVIPNDGNWHRLTLPLQDLVPAWNNPKAKDKIIRTWVGVDGSVPTETPPYQTEMKNLRLWKRRVNDVTVERLAGESVRRAPPKVSIEQSKGSDAYPPAIAGRMKQLDGQIQSVIDAANRKIDWLEKQAVRDLQHTQDQLTRQGRLDDAVAVKEQICKLSEYGVTVGVVTNVGDHLPVPAPLVIQIRSTNR